MQYIMGGSWSDEARLQRMLDDTKSYMRKHGEAIPTDATQNVPEYFDKDKEAVRFFIIVHYECSTETKRRLYGQPFSIGSQGEPYSYAQRKKMNLVDPRNPFGVLKGEGEDMVINWVLAHKDKVGLESGGRVENVELDDLTKSERQYVLGHGTLPSKLQGAMSGGGSVESPWGARPVGVGLGSWFAPSIFAGQWEKRRGGPVLNTRARGRGGF